MFYFFSSKLKQGAGRKVELNNSNFFLIGLVFIKLNVYHFLRLIIVCYNVYSININNNDFSSKIANIIVITSFFDLSKYLVIYIKINKNKISILYDQIFIYFDFQIVKLKIIFF